jgi:hypothetical protein
MVRLLLVLLMVSVLVAGQGSVPTQASRAAVCSPRVSLIAHGFGSPDDVAISGGRVLFGDLANGTLDAEHDGRVTVLASGLRTPEGIVVEKPDRVVVVEQGLNRLDQIDLKTGRRHVLVTMRNNTENEGIDGIHAAPHGGIYIPDSPYGTLYVLDSQRRLHLLVQGLSRPVDAIHYHGGVAIADENARAVWFVKNGHVRRLATLDVPDDLAIFHGHLLADSLGDGKVWEVAPRLKRLASGFDQPQGLAVLNQQTVIVTSSNTNGIYAVSHLAACL